MVIIDDDVQMKFCASAVLRLLVEILSSGCVRTKEERMDKGDDGSFKKELVGSIKNNGLVDLVKKRPQL